MRPINNLLVRLWPRLPLPARFRGWLIWLLRPKFIVGVEALLEDDGGRFLLGRHSYRPKRPWGPLGGAVEADENLAAALRREVREECGLDVAVGPIVAVMRGVQPRRLDFVLRCRVIGGTCVPSTEVPEVRWCTPAELDTLLTSEDRWFAALARRPAAATPEHGLVVQ